MKKVYAIIAFVLVSGSIIAQTTSTSKLKFGVKAGVNFANQEFTMENVSVKPSSLTSFHIFGLVDYSISPAISIQPGLGLSGKGTKMELEGFSAKYDLMYLDIPVNLVAKFPIPSFGKFFIGAGPYAAFGISGKAKGNGVDESQKDVDLFSKDGPYKKSDFGINLLGGLEFNKGFTLNANYGLGLADISSEDGTKIKNKVVSVSVGFLF